MTEEQRERLLPESTNDHGSRTAPLFLGYQDRMNMEYFRDFLQNSSSENCEEAALKTILGTCESSVKLDYVHFPLKLMKVQKREKGISTQGIEEGNVSFSLDFQTAENKMNVTGISVSVKRTGESGNSQKSLGCVPIPKVEISHFQETKILVKLDLDSVNTHGGRKVYELDRTKERDNLFHLVIDIKFNNGNVIQQTTRSFALINRKGTPPVGGKRPHSESSSPPINSPDSGLDSVRPVSVESEVFSPAYNSPFIPHTSESDDNAGLIEARMIVCEHIKTKFLDLDGESINLGKAITTPNGDIAYHFLLQNDDDVFEEGEIVGFVPNEYSDKKQVITKLTFKSASRAILKGVVTRSQYLEALKPSPGVRTETIAMMGIVPVQVRGSVCANEALYASPHHPGFAVSGHFLETETLNEAAFIGYAFSGRQTDDDHSAGMVQAAVSILQSAGQKLLSEKVRRLEEQFDERIITINRFGRLTRRCMCIGVIATFITFTLVTILLWQLLVPGTAFRYYVCERGRKVPHGKATFSMQPLSTPHLNAIVNGIEFEFDTLMKKAGHEEYPRLNITGARYYLNIDRCAYGYVTTGDIPSGIKPIRGPTVFVVDEKCFSPYYFDESTNKWIKYNSSSWRHYKNICCEPHSKWKTCEELRSAQLCSKTKCR